MRVAKSVCNIYSAVLTTRVSSRIQRTVLSAWVGPKGHVVADHVAIDGHDRLRTHLTRSPAPQLPAAAQEPPRLPSQRVPAPRLARWITIAMVCGIAVGVVLNVVTASEGQSDELAFGTSCVVAVFLIQLHICVANRDKWSTRRRTLLVAAEFVLVYAPFLVTGNLFGSMAGPLAGTALLLMPPRVAWSIFGIVTGSIGVLAVVLHYPPNYIAYLPVSTALTGLTIWGLTRLTDLVHEVHAARDALARMAVVQERLRFARDTHDLLGYSLSAITLKCELIYRLVPNQLEKARAEIESVLVVSRQALADVRLVASGYRELSLAAEVDSVARLLAAADVDADLGVDCGRLHPIVDTTLATALREGVTNMLRHSNVTACTIKAHAEDASIRLTLVNDGVVRTEINDHDSGSGLENLTSRLEAIGGTLTAGLRADGRFQLAAVAPRHPDGARSRPADFPAPSAKPEDANA